MFQIIPVIYEHGVFRPLKKVKIREKKRLIVQIGEKLSDLEDQLDENDKELAREIKLAYREYKSGKFKPFTPLRRRK